LHYLCLHDLAPLTWTFLVSYHLAQLAINQLQLSAAFRCDRPVPSDLPSLSGRLAPSLSIPLPCCQSSERAFCALTKALSVSLWFVTPKRAFHGVLSEFFFPICQDTLRRGEGDRDRGGERGGGKIVPIAGNLGALLCLFHVQF